MPIKAICLNCGKILWRSPSKIEPRNYCSTECYSEVRNRELVKFGHKFPKGRPEMPKRVEALRKLSGKKHYAWKGSQVSYRGLHYWLRRKLGKPTKCLHCGKIDKRPKFIQWANIDGKYRRVLTDYISLCTSCHKIYDLTMKSTQDSQTAIRQ